MSNTTATAILTPAELFAYWQGHRQLTRRVIDAFPEKELFEFSIGGMRPFAAISKELLSMAAPTLKQIVTGDNTGYEETKDNLKTKSDILNAWDEATQQIDIYSKQIPEEKFREVFNLYGQYSYPFIDNLNYIIDNEIHHRGQGYVYLRALGITPPGFYERPPFGNF